MLPFLERIKSLFVGRHEGGYVSDGAILEPSEVEFPMKTVIKEPGFSDKQKQQIRKIVREEINNDSSRGR